MSGIKKIVSLYAGVIMLALFLSVNPASMPVTYASDDSQINLQTIYHTYIDTDYLGSVRDESIVIDYLTARVEEMNQSNDKYTYGYEQELIFVPERVFNDNTNTIRVLNRLDQEVHIDIQATTLQIGDHILGHFASEEESNQALYDYKNLYVDADVLDQPLDNPETIKEIELEIGESVVIDVSFSDEVTAFTSIVSENELITVEEALEIFKKGTLEDIIHNVSKGETLYSIAKTYDLTLDTVLELNPTVDINGALQLDQALNVTDYVTFTDVVVHEESLEEEIIAFEQRIEESDELYRGETKKKQAGQDGKKKIHTQTKIVNGKIVESERLSEEVIKEVQHEITLKGTKVIPSRGTGDFVWPAVGGYISSHYGPRWGTMHRGIDIARPTNRNILASDNGVVEKVAYNANGYGHYVIINHNNGYKTLYGHLASTSVKVGQTVPKGTKIGVMGTTGRSTGIHLHFEVIKNGTKVNPINYLK